MQSILISLLIAARFAVCLSILNPVDFLGLQSIRKSLDDMPGSAFFSAWDFTADPCGFPGVFCAGDRVAALALGDPRAGAPGLTGTLDPAIGRLSALTEFSLVPGRVTGSIPDSLSLCTNLRFLALGRNYLTGDIPYSISRLGNLRTLDLSFNDLSGAIPAAGPALSNMILCHNRFSGVIPAFPATSQLLRLDLKHNDLSGEIPTNLPATLNYLSLSANRLSGTVDRLLPQLQHLNYLDLSMNQLWGTIPGCLFSFPLAVLQLQRNFFTGLVRPEVEVVIPVVDLSYNRLTGPVPQELAAVGSLYLNNNRFIGEVPAKFTERLLGSGMQLLYLQHNFLTGMEISPAAEIPVSSSLCLQYNCMVPPVEAPCPLKAGNQKSRPTTQCPEWRV